VGFGISLGAGCRSSRVGFAARIAAWSLSIAALARSPARAELPVEPSPVVTTVDPCVPVDLPHFRRLLSIELGTSIDYQPQAPREPGRTWVHLACAPAGIVLNLEDGLTGKSMARILDASDIEPSDSTRLLALAVAEFVVASWVELRAVPRPTLPAIGAAPPSAASRVAAQTVQRKLAEGDPGSQVSPWEISAGFGLDTFTSHAVVLPTFSLRMQISLPPVAFALGGDLGFVSVPVVRDDTRAGGIDVTRTSGLAALLFGGDLGPVTLWGGPGVRFGVIRMAAEAEIDNLLSKRILDPHGGVLLLGHVTHRFTDHFGIGLEIELGLVTLPVAASVQDSVLLEFSGAWFSAGLRGTVSF
jgi:hypothetical protein